MATLILEESEVELVAHALKHYSEWLASDFKAVNAEEGLRAAEERRKSWTLRDRISEWFRNLPSSAEI